MAALPSMAVLGTGIMGSAMAARWADHGAPLSVWNRSRAKAEPLGAAGARVAGTPAEAVAAADVVVTMLADGDVTDAVMGEALPAARRGALWLQMATVGLAATDRLADRAAAAGLRYVDAPVLGTKAPAEQGALTVFASGPEGLRAECEPLFSPVATAVHWVGGVGAGTRLKLVVNAWLASLVAGLAESVALAEGLGIDPRKFLDAIDNSAIGPAYAQVKGAMMIERSYPVSFPLHLLTKDVRLVAEAASGAGVDLRLPPAIEGLLSDAEATHAAADMSALVEPLRPDAP